jgi:hypothetical protein
VSADSWAPVEVTDDHVNGMRVPTPNEMYALTDYDIGAAKQ